MSFPGDPQGSRPAADAGAGPGDGWPLEALSAGGAGAWRWEPESGLVRCSAELARRWAPEAREAVTGTLEEFLARVAPQDRASLGEALARAAAREGAFRLEFRLVQAGGAVDWIEIRGRVLGGSGGEPRRLAGIATSLTERRLSARSLTESEARLRAVVDTAVDGIITIDEGGLILSVNPAAERLFGYRAAELVGQNVSMLMPEPYHSEHDGYLRRYRETGERRIIGIGREVVGRRRDGSEFPLDLSVSETVLTGRRFFTGIVRDITARKRDEQALRQGREELARVNAGLEQRVAERTAALRRQSEQLRRLAGALAAAEQAERKRIARVLHDHLQQLLVAARMRIGASRVGLTPAAAENLAEAERILNEAITSARDLTAQLSPPILHQQGLAAGLRHLAQEVERQHGLRVSLEQHGRVEVALEPAGHLLYEAARELLFNVVKHAGTAEAQVRLRADGGELRLEVADQGRGFDPEAEEVREKPGGFGLFSLRERLTALGGSLHHDSRPGAGTRAEIRLPLAATSSAKPA